MGNELDPLSLNLYIYCGNNPIIFVDPSGHDSEEDSMNQQIAWEKENGLYEPWTLEQEISLNKKAMSNSPVQIIIEGNNIRVNVNIVITGIANETVGSSQETYKDLVVAGIKMWEGEYEVYGFKSNLEISVNCITDPYEINEDIKKLIPINVTSRKGRDFVWYGIDFWNKWMIEDPGRMILKSGNNISNKNFSRTVAHEFGHILGLGDVYSNKDEDNNPVVPISYDLPSNHIMRYQFQSNIQITNITIENVLKAFSNNKQEKFY